jgi:hypothetical protein
MSEEFIVDWGNSILIPEGEYQAVYVSHMTTNGSYGPKVKITFRIVSLGAHFETLIDAWYNLKSTGEKVGKRGRTGLSKHSKLTLEMMNLFIHRKQRLNRISPEQLKGYIVVIKVRTVKQNSKQKMLPVLMHYSTVDAMVCILNYQDISESPLLKPVPIPEPKPTTK